MAACNERMSHANHSQCHLTYLLAEVERTVLLRFDDEPLSRAAMPTLLSFSGREAALRPRRSMKTPKPRMVDHGPLVQPGYFNGCAKVSAESLAAIPQPPTFRTAGPPHLLTPVDGPDARVLSQGLPTRLLFR